MSSELTMELFRVSVSPVLGAPPILSKCPVDHKKLSYLVQEATENGARFNVIQMYMLAFCARERLSFIKDMLARSRFFSNVSEINEVNKP